MSQANEDNTEDIELTEDQALAWLGAQPGGQIKTTNAELARRWGWTETRVGRWIERWIERGLIERKGRVLTVLGGVTGDGTSGQNNTVTNDESSTVTDRAVVPVTSRKVARSNTPANRVVRRACAEPVDAMTPIVTVPA